MPNSQPVNSDYVIVAPPSPPAFSAEWALFNFLGKWEPNDLEIAIRKDWQVDFSGYTKYVVDYAITEILKKFEINRPDLCKVLSSKEGKAWLRRRILEALTPK